MDRPRGGQVGPPSIQRAAGRFDARNLTISGAGRQHLASSENRVRQALTTRFLGVEACVRDKAERQILSALREGRREAYEAVIDAHYGSVYRFLMFLTREASLAEDLTQEVFTAAWGALGRFEGRASIKTWLHRIAYNTFVDVRVALGPRWACRPPRRARRGAGATPLGVVLRSGGRVGGG